MTTTALVLPTFPADLVTQFTHTTGGTELRDLATGLAKLGVLRPEHLRGDAEAAVQAALAHHVGQARPEPLAPLNLAVLGEAPIDDGRLQYDYPSFKGENVRAFAIGVREGEPEIAAHLGRPLLALERRGKGQGEAVLDVLHLGLRASVRSLMPANVLDWAECRYWRGESDESELIEEEMREYRANAEFDKLSDEQLRQKIVNEHGIITLESIKSKFPEWALRPRTVKRLPRGLPAPVYAAAERVMQLTASAPEHLHDLRYASDGSWDVCPFLFQWNEEAMTPRIWDDVINHHYECGDTDLGLNALFLFWDQRSLAYAVQRLTHFLQLTQACEQLLRALRVRFV